jgi:threonine dehydratase
MSAEQDFAECAALGLASATMTPFEAFSVSARIVHDNVLLKRKVWKKDGSFHGRVLGTLEAIADLTDQEKTELRERVIRGARK